MWGADKQHRQRRLRALAFVGGVIVAVWLVVAIGVRAAYADNILPGTNMGGVSLGGRSSERAGDLLASAFERGQSVTLTGGGRRFVISAAEVGYGSDVPASATRARSAGREGPLGGLWSTVASLAVPRTLEPVARVDRRRIAARVAAIADAIDRPAAVAQHARDGDREVRGGRVVRQPYTTRYDRPPPPE